MCGKTIDERVEILEQQMAQLLLTQNAPSAPTTDKNAYAFALLDSLKTLTADKPQGAVMFTGYYRPSAERHNEAEWQFTMDNNELLSQQWSSLAEPLAALSHPVRLSLLQSILLGITTATSLAAQRDLGSTGQVYHHLNVLQGAGWIRRDVAEGYFVPQERIIALLVILVAAQH